MSNTETTLPETDGMKDGEGTARVKEQSTPAQSTKSRGLRRFRQANPRIDYYPFEAAQAAIAETQKAFPGYPTRSIIDLLVVTGFEAFSGKK